MRALRNRLGEGVRFGGIGGRHMAEQGLASLFPIAELSIIGFAAIPKRLPMSLRRIREAAQAVLAAKPDVLVIIDSPDFTHRVARRVRAADPAIPIVDYVSPTVWAWRPGRARAMARYVDHVLALLPFEPEVHRRLGGPPCTYVGHPLIEQLSSLRPGPEDAARRAASPPVLLLLPGSRRQEIALKLPEMLKMVAHFPDHQFVVAQAPSIPDEVYREFIGNKNVWLAKGQTYELLRQAEAALVTSGTATLETALFGVPQVVCYKGNEISYQLAKRLIKVKYISLVNLIMDKLVVTELIQHELNERRLHEELGKLLFDKAHRQRLIEDYAQLWHLLGNIPASATAAKEIIAAAKK